MFCNPIIGFDSQDGKITKAKDKFKEILDKTLDLYGEDDRRFGAASHNLGITHFISGDLSDAFDAIEAAIRVRKKALGKYHPKVAVSSLC